MKFTLIFAVSVIFAAFGVFADSAEKTYYSQKLYTRVDKSAIRQSIDSSLTRLKTELPNIENFIKVAASEKHILADAFAKRLEITQRLGSYLENLLKSNEPDVLLYARQGKRELEQLLDYFKEAEARARFLKAAPPETVINLKDFGATGDGIRNDAPAFVEAVAQAKKTTGRVKLFIPAGTYLFGSYKAKRSFPTDAENWRTWKPDYKKAYDHLHIPCISNMKNFAIEGEKGSILLSADPRRGFFFFRSCSYLTVRNLTFDYKQLPFTQGSVTKIDRQNRMVSLKLDHGFPAPDLDYLLMSDSLYGIAYDKSGKNIRNGFFQRINGVKDLGNGLYQLKFLKTPDKQLEPGCRLVINARRDSVDGNILRGILCDHTLIDNVTVHAAPATAFGGFLMNDCAVINCRITPPEGSGRLHSINADPCMIGNGAIGPYLANNVFEYVGDDAANEYIRARQIKSISKDGSTIVVKWGAFRSGDVISLLSPNDGVIKDESTINSVVDVSHGLQQLTLDTPFPADVPTLDLLKKKAFPSKKEADNFNMHAAVTPAPIPCAVLPRDRTGSGTVFVNNVFRYAYRGILVKVSNALLDGNTIENMDREAVSIMIYAHYWLESNAAHNVVVRNNSFRNNGGVSSYYQIHNSKVAPGLTPLRDILIENNAFINTPAVFDNSQDIKVIHNEFDRGSPLRFGVARKVLIEGNTFATPKGEAIKIGADAKGVTIEANTFGKYQKR